MPIVIIGGPTASGKSALAIEFTRRLAEQHGGGVIINADALQLYRDLSILTARPDAEEEAAVSHRLYGVLDGAERGTVARWLQMAVAEIEAAQAAGRIPVLVGGSGMYIHTLMQGLAEVPDIAPDIRVATVERHAALGGEAFRRELLTLDPTSAGLFAGDMQRLIRAYEVVKGTGRALREWQQDKSAWSPPMNWRFVPFVLTPEREMLYQNCNHRFVKMLEKGALAEVKTLLARQLDPQLPIMKAVGVPELADLLAGQLSEAEAIAKGQQATRNYAKRQLTWFRHHLKGALRVAPVTSATVDEMIVALKEQPREIM